MTGTDFLDKIRRAGALVSGGPVQEGWGRPPFMTGKPIAHHWAKSHTDVSEYVKGMGVLGEGAYGLRSACGRHTLATKRVPLLGPGNLPFCVRCENQLMKQGAAG